MSEPPPLYRSRLLEGLPHVQHGISTRAGGVSDGVWASLNLSYTVGDDRQRVDENVRRLCGALDVVPEALFSAYQVHGRTAVVVDDKTPARPHCDALVTSQPGRALLLRFADCVPILLADTHGRAVGVAHAGWRGTAAGVAGAAVAEIAAAFGCQASGLVAAVGPSIGPCCYEVGPDVSEVFRDQPWAVQRRDTRRAHLDLWELNRRALLDAGIPSEHVEVAGVCTRCHAEEYFSYRAMGSIPSGRFAAVIGLVADYA